MVKSVFALLLLCMITTSALAQEQSQPPADGASLDEVLDTRTSYQNQAQSSQQRVEALDDETMRLIARYNAELERHADLLAYNENLRALIDNQQREQSRLNAELKEIEVVRQDIVPLMLEMVEVLERFIELDQPILLDERRARLAKLKNNLTRSDVELAERYRRLLEAYQIEADYGQSLEAYEGTIEQDGNRRAVDFLRLGRVAVYFLSLDRSEAGIWDPGQGRWQALGSEDLEALDFAIRVARQQAPPNLFDLPLWTEPES